MIYLTQYRNRKGELIIMKYYAPNSTSIKERIRREKAKDNR